MASSLIAEVPYGCSIHAFGHGNLEVAMNFIERLFGFTPDGGSGGLEFLLLVVPIAGLCYLALSRRRRHE